MSVVVHFYVVGFVIVVASSLFGKPLYGGKAAILVAAIFGTCIEVAYLLFAAYADPQNSQGMIVLWMVVYYFTLIELDLFLRSLLTKNRDLFLSLLVLGPANTGLLKPLIIKYILERSHTLLGSNLVIMTARSIVLLVLIASSTLFLFKQSGAVFLLSLVVAHLISFVFGALIMVQFWAKNRQFPKLES